MKKGFTLIELLIVVAIIAILAAIAVPNFLEAQMRAKLASSKSDLRTLTVAFESYRVDHLGYPYDWNTPKNIDGFAQSEWDTYAAVTTPVAYASVIPKDIFQLSSPPHKWEKAGALYEFWGTDANRRDIRWASTGTQWLMIGYGPDQDRDIRNGRDLSAFIINTYDATNGTISSGDIINNNLLKHSFFLISKAALKEEFLDRSG